MSKLVPMTTVIRAAEELLDFDHMKIVLFTEMIEVETDPVELSHYEKMQAAAHVLHLRGQGGYPPGSFTQKLLECFESADSLNRQKLGAAFPAEYRALRIYATQGVDALRKWGSINV